MVRIRRLAALVALGAAALAGTSAPGNPSAGAAATSAAGSAAARAAATRAAAREIAQDLFARMNDERRARGIAAVRWDESLAFYATAWSLDMARNGFRHSNFARLVSASGPYNQAAENIAWAQGGPPTSRTMHMLWMRSAPHRANMLARSLNRVGIGVYCAPNGTLWATQTFARAASTGNPSPIPSVSEAPITRRDTSTLTCSG